MQLSLALLGLAAATVVSAQGLTSQISPTGSAPAGCVTDYAGSFEITVALPPASKKRSMLERRGACASDGTLVASLSGSVLTDAKGRIGGIVANHQFQFDGPPSQTGTIYNAGFSVCSNGSLALGPSAIFYQCLSGSFYNLYNTAAGASCEEVVIDILACGGSDPDPVGQSSDGQPTASSAITQISDGQPQASSAASQISDGQPQVPSATPVSQFTDGQIQVTASPGPAPISTVTATPISQISDGQPQAPTGTVTATPVSQISDGQPQAPTGTVTATPVSQISDGQPQAPSATSAPASSSSPVQISANAAATAAAGGHLAAGVVAFMALAAAL